MSFDLLTRKLAEQVYTKPGGIASIWRGSECRYLDLDQPNFSKQDGRLRFTTHGAGALGAEVLQTCLRPISWRGYIETFIEPYVTVDWQMRLRMQDSTLYDEEWKKGLLTGLLWEVTERFFLPKLKTLAFDLAPPRDAVLSLLKVSAPSSTAEQAKLVVDSATPKSVEVREPASSCRWPSQFPIPWLTRQPATQLEAPLSPAELDQPDHGSWGFRAIF